MAITICPHCSAENRLAAAYCGACGKALPSPIPTAPRVVTGKDVATTSAGMKLQVDTLHNDVKRAAGALLSVAIIQTALAALVYIGIQNASRGRAPIMNLNSSS
jgi:hypothetical protein